MRKFLLVFLLLGLFFGFNLRAEGAPKVKQPRRMKTTQREQDGLLQMDSNKYKKRFKAEEKRNNRQEAKDKARSKKEEKLKNKIELRTQKQRDTALKRAEIKIRQRNKSK